MSSKNKSSNRKLYLIATVILLAVVSIAASVYYVSKNETVSTLQTLKTRDERPSGGSKEEKKPTSVKDDDTKENDVDDDKAEDTYPFRIFFMRYVDGEGAKIFSTKSDGSDLQSHYKTAKSGLSLSNLFTSNKGTKLFFFDYHSLKCLNLAKDEVEDLGLKGSGFSLSSDDKKLVYVSAGKPSELLIYNIKSKKVELQKDFSCSISAPQFISNDSKILLKVSEAGKPSKMVELDIETGNFENSSSFDDNAFQFKLSPDRKIMAYLVRGIPSVLKIYDFDSKTIKDCYQSWAGLSILRWSEDGKSIYISGANNFLNEFNLDDMKLVELKDENGQKIVANY